MSKVGDELLEWLQPPLAPESACWSDRGHNGIQVTSARRRPLFRLQSRRCLVPSEQNVATHRLEAAIVTAALLGAAWGNGCGASEDEPKGSSSTGGAGGGGAGSSSDAGAEGGSADAGPTTNAYDPCAAAACWTAPTLGACGSTTIDEDFSSGLYNVHHYLLMAPAGVELDLTLTRTAGSWSPTFIVHDEQGTTIHDGEESYSTSALQVSTVSPAPSPDVVAVRIQASTRQHLAVFVTGTSVVASDFASALPTDAEYTLEAALDCTPPGPLHVRGVELDAEQELWVRYIAAHVVPQVPGSAGERIDKSAYVTWWALKEGVLNVNNPLSYSNCSFPPDQHIGPVEVCPNPDNAWQVGLSGVQAAWRTLESVEEVALTVYPQEPIGEILVDAAITAGFGVTTSLGQTIASSDDRLRLSWLLRNGPVGFEAQYPVVYNECFVSVETWCFGSGWPTSAAFAPTQAAAQEAVTDLKSIFQTLSP